MTSITLAGHLFAPNGMGEQARSGLRALIAAGLSPEAYDIYRHAERHDPDIRTLVVPVETPSLTDGIRIFHVNGDEVDDVSASLELKGTSLSTGYNIIVPAWELPYYPKLWAPNLQRFDEVWAISRFVHDSLQSAGIASHYVGQSVDIEFDTYLPRRFFGIRESAFVLLYFFDASSYAHRKNPFAVINLMQQFRKLRPYDDVQLVLKIRAQRDDALLAELQALTPAGTILLTADYDSHKARSLVANCDCFVSLHRSEGFGRGMAEAMTLGRLALATGWSGNCDYMSCNNSLFVDHQIVAVPEGYYPHWEGQHWAEPDLEHALHLLLKCIDDPTWSRNIARKGWLDSQRLVTNRPVGVRVLERLATTCDRRGWSLN